ncbi:MAG: LytR family transcriptional regulator [Ruminococcaceae bacterium]|nr:LytR family transcriptional regulator [Oscillospiraceae bacterium]
MSHRLSKREKRKLIRAISIVLAVSLAFVAVLKLIGWWENRQGGEVVPKSDEPKLNPYVDTLLVMGIDKYADGAGSKQADFILLFVIDDSDKSYTAVQISRDTVAEVKVLDITGNKVIDRVEKQIALAYSYGDGKKTSCLNVADSVSALFGGVAIEHYVSVSMDAVPVLNDFVGGVEVEVLDDFTGIDDSLVKGQTVTLMGDSALTYVRTRQGLADPSNENRMARQRQYLKGLYEKSVAAASENQSFAEEALSAVKDYTVSNSSVAVFDKLLTYTQKGLIALEGESRKGEQFMEFYPDEEFLNKTVTELFYQ